MKCSRDGTKHGGVKRKYACFARSFLNAHKVSTHPTLALQTHKQRGAESLEAIQWGELTHVPELEIKNVSIFQNKGSRGVQNVVWFGPREKQHQRGRVQTRC